MAQEQKSENGWRFDRSVSITHIIATISAIVAMVGFGYNMNSRLSLVEQALAQSVITQRVTDERQDTIVMEMRKQTREDFKVINDKLDRLFERTRPLR